MNIYNNMFSKTSVGENSTRFNNKRPRFNAGSCVNNSDLTRYPPPQQYPYQRYTKCRNNIAEVYQPSPNQYDSDSRHIYGQRLPKRQEQQNHLTMQNSKKSPLYKHNLKSVTNSMSSLSSYAPATPNTLKSPPPIPNSIAQSTFAPKLTHNSQQQQLQQQTPHVAQIRMESPSYYSYGYNAFIPPYGSELITSATSAIYSIPDAINPYMWQTITSTPPPKLPPQTQQQQLRPPPLPQQQPPVQPPLPREENTPTAQPAPPPPISTVNTSQTIQENNNQYQEHELNSAPKTIIKMKARRKAMAMRYKMSKSWTEVDAALALKAEETNARNLQKDIILIIRFPDPEISREIVKCYSPDIKSVHFQLNFAPRYCLVHLKPGANVEKTIETLSKIPFGTGFLSVEIKQISRKAHTTKWNEIDPYTLYVGNLPTTIACSTLKYHFPGAARIDIGFAQRMKYTRYAFIRYRTVQQAIEAYKRMLDAEIGGRTLTIRFRRLTSSSDCNKDGEVESNEEAQDDVLSQPSIAAEDNSMSSSLIIEPSETFDEKSSIEDSAVIQEEQTNIISNETTHGNDDDHDLDQNNGTHSYDRVAEETSVTDVVNSESTTADNPTRTLPNIKPDPDVDSYDIVMRNDEITTRFVMNEHNIKQENELSTEFEFFAPISTQDNTNSANGNKSLIQDAVSVQSITGETDNSSTMSASSLGEFLQTCQRPRVESNDIDDIIGPPQRKQGRQDNAALNSAVKTEPIEKKDTRVKDNSTVLSNNAIKREATTNQENTSVININSMDSGNEAVYKQDENLRPRKTNTHNLTTESTLSNNDDLVPSNALFLRYGNRSCLEYGNDVCDNNEFFETITKNSVERPSQVMKSIKTEPICRRVNKRSNEIITNCYQSKSSENSRVIDSISNRSQLQTKNDSAPLAGVDDDLVPEQNILSSRLTLHTDSLNNSHQQYFKEETENDDLFSIPLINSRNDATNNQSEDSDLGDLWNLSSDSNHKIQKTKAVSKNCTPMGSNEDDDIILVSDTISRHPKNAGSKFTPMKTNTFTCNQVDLLSFKHKITMAEGSWEISKVLPHHHHDNLDKLFDQLDSYSDSEL